MLFFQQALQQLLQPKINTSTSNKAAQSGTNLQKLNQKKKDEKKNSLRSSNLPNEENEVFNEHKLKYKLLRVAIDAIDFWLVESGAALHLWVRSESIQKLFHKVVGIFLNIRKNWKCYCFMK